MNAGRVSSFFLATLLIAFSASNAFAADSSSATEPQTIQGKVVATKWDETKKVTAVDITTADGIVYHTAGDKAGDLFQHVDHVVKVTGTVVEASGAKTITVISFEMVKDEKASGN
jgi:hypothetical protein